MKRLFNRELVEIFLLFAAWRIWITVFALFGIVFFQPYSRDLFGGGFNNYIGNPLFWGWSNFDGEHYISIAQYGYKDLQHSFFPLYPLLINILSPEKNMESYVLTGLLLSNVSFLASLIVFRKLVKNEYGDKVARMAIISLLIFPTSFFFGAVYTESLFLLTILLSFYFVIRQKWLLSGIFGMLASVTRIQGVFLLPSFFLGHLKHKGRGLRVISIALIPIGIFVYLYFLYQTTGNALAFYTDLKSFGQQREVGKFVLLPQVLWRYIKMLTSLKINSPIYLTISMEFLTAILGLILIVWGFLKRLKPAYLVFALLSYILPTLSGSFSSLPRYILILFPLFIIMGIFLSKQRIFVRTAVLSLLTVLLIIETMLFVRGYWVG